MSPNDIPGRRKEPPLRVTFVINAPITGGAEKHTLGLADGLAALGCECSVFAMRRGDLAAPPGIRLLQPEAGQAYAPLRRIRDLARLLAADRPNVVVCVNERPVLIGFLARLVSKFHCPIVAIAHSSVLRTRKEKLWRLIYQPLYSRAQSVVFISENQRRLWRSRGLTSRDEVTILNGIDMSRFSLASRHEHREPMRRELGFSAGDFVVGCCAVLRPEKNHVQLVEAVARARSRNIPAKALLVGDGPMRATIERAATRAGVEDHVLLVGARPDVRPFIAAFDIGVLCSTAIETLSLAALEILASGVPMLMSDIGGAPEIVNGRNGATFPVGGAEELVSLIERFYQVERDEGFALETRASVETKFDRKAMIVCYLKHLSRF